MYSDLIAATAVAVVFASDAAPRPPCPAPEGIIPAVHESMCSTIVVKKNAAGVEVRSYGVPTEEVLVTDLTPSNFPYATVLELSVSNILLYLEIDNSSRENILANRTVPITVRPPPSNDGWLVSMMVSTAAFPTGLVPTPNNFEMHLESMTKRLFATLAFNTSTLPIEQDFKTACADLANGLPSSYTVVEDGWSPTYAIYSGRDSKLFTNECWVQVKAK